MSTKSTGSKGEDIASAFLKKKNYKILSRNFRTRYGELDIVAQDKDIIVFVEVKTRKSRSHGTGIEAITPQKIEKLHQISLQYMQKVLGYEPKCRFDVIDILIQDNLKIKHIKNAF